MSSVDIKSEDDLLISGNKPAQRSFYSKITEDGWALWIGGLLTGAVLLLAFLARDFKFTPPLYQWSVANELGGKIFTNKNLLLFAGIGFVWHAHDG